MVSLFDCLVEPVRTCAPFVGMGGIRSPEKSNVSASVTTEEGSAVSRLNTEDSSGSLGASVSLQNVYSGDGIRQVRPSPPAYPLPPLKVEVGSKVVSFSPPPFPALTTQVEGGSRGENTGDASGYPIPTVLGPIRDERSGGEVRPFEISPPPFPLPPVKVEVGSRFET